MASNVKEGQKFTYVGSEPVVSDDGTVTIIPGPPVGVEVTVRNIVPADEAGAHNNDEDSVVVEWTELGTVANEEVEPILVPYTDKNKEDRTRAVWPTTTGEVTRAMSVGMEDFATRFQAVK